MRSRQVGRARRFTRPRHSMKRLGVAASLAALSLAASASTAAGAVTIGQLAPGTPPLTSCSGDPEDWFTPTVGSGNSYVVPGAGTIVSWSTNAAAGPDQMLTMKIFRKFGADPLVYSVVAHDTRPLTGGTLNTFPVGIPVQAGDVLGLNSASANASGPVANACQFFSPGGVQYAFSGDVLDGQVATFELASPDFHANIAAVFEPSATAAVPKPSNTFTLGKTERNQKKGTATITVNVPNPGKLTGSGSGVSAAVISKPAGAGQAQLLIKAKGKKKRKLNDTGKVTLNVAITFTPTGGDPRTKSVKVKLKKNL